MAALMKKSTRTPVGHIQCLATHEALVGVYLEAQADGVPAAAPAVGRHPVLDQAVAELEAYFAGRLVTFTTPLSVSGTEFQQQVWRALLEIPFGETQSYSAIAQRIGRPKAVRAVGAANGKNAISVFIPCHRVIGASGSLTGYAGGVIHKKWLLNHERIIRERTPAVLQGEREFPRVRPYHP